jgi:hypothetical protein
VLDALVRGSSTSCCSMHGLNHDGKQSHWVQPQECRSARAGRPRWL